MVISLMAYFPMARRMGKEYTKTQQNKRNTKEFGLWISKMVNLLKQRRKRTSKSQVIIKTAKDTESSYLKTFPQAKKSKRKNGLTVSSFIINDSVIL
jgi:hypothetical protein